MQETIRIRRNKVTSIVAELSGHNNLVLSYVEACGIGQNVVVIYLKNLRLLEGKGRTFEEAYDDVIKTLNSKH